MADCGDDVVTGMACKGRYCDDIQLTCGVVAANRASYFQDRWEDAGCSTLIPQSNIDDYVENNMTYSQVGSDMNFWATSLDIQHIDACMSEHQVANRPKENKATFPASGPSECPNLSVYNAKTKQ